MAGLACAAETQCEVPLTRRPSGASPPREAGSQVQCSSTISPAGFLTTLTHLMRQAQRSRISAPGERRNHFLGGTSQKSSRSM